MTTSNFSLHWLTATIHRDSHMSPEAQAAKLAQSIERCDHPEPADPFPRNYTKAIRGTLGTFSWHPDRDDMKICYNLTGTQLEAAYAQDLPHTRLLRALMGNAAAFTRIDLALDYPVAVDIGEVVRAAKAHPETTRAKTLIPYDQVELSEGVRQRTTGVYVGSTKSERWLTVYDKALELQLPDLLLTRIEARNRKRKAQQVADMLERDTIPKVTRSVIRDFADLPLDWWQDALTGPSTELPPVGRKQTDTEKWLCEVIAPLLDREIKATGGPAGRLYQTFVKVIVDNTQLSSE